MPATSKIHLSVEECYEFAVHIADEIQRYYKHKPFHGIVAILNGGMLPAYWLRKIFKKRGIDLAIRTIDVQSYSNYTDRQGQVRILEKPDLGNDGQGWLFVDEIADSGETIKALRTLFPGARFACLTTKDHGKNRCDFYAKSYAQDEWIVFPWEQAESNN